jgi:hypothetical protein
MKLLENAASFIENVLLNIKKIGIEVSNYELDHVCYRVETQERYTKLKKALFDYGELLTEAKVGNRLISTFKLKTPIIYQNRKIWCFELPSPKEGSYYKEGYEHIEFVIDSNFEQFIQKYPKINFDTHSMTKEINPDISINFDNYSVKFHLASLENVIKIN